MKFYLKYSVQKKKYVIYDVVKITKSNDDLLPASSYLDVETYQVLLKYKSMVSSVRLGGPLEDSLFDTKKELIIRTNKYKNFVNDVNSVKFLKTCHRYICRFYPEELL